jgi:hypothetical protein
MKYFLFFTLGVVCMTGCNKPLMDYRSKYTGTYNVVSYNSSWSGSNYQEDTVTYTLKVKRSKERYYVDFVSPNGSTSYLLETDGTLHYESNDWHYQVNGGFIDKNHFHLTGGYYGLGGGNSFDATGTKR